MVKTKRRDDLIIGKVVKVENELHLGGTEVTATADELNINDGLSRSAAELNLLVQGLAAGYKLARGSVAATANKAVATGLSSIVGFALAPVAETATKGNLAVLISGKVSGGTLTVYRWKHTGPSTSTLVAATSAGTIDWLAVGA
jgi:hypothetical protein